MPKPDNSKDIEKLEQMLSEDDHKKLSISVTWYFYKTLKAKEKTKIIKNLKKLRQLDWLTLEFLAICV